MHPARYMHADLHGKGLEELSEAPDSDCVLVAGTEGHSEDKRSTEALGCLKG